MGPLDKHDNSYRTENSELFDLSFICNRNHWFVINFLTSGCLQQQQTKTKKSFSPLLFLKLFSKIFIQIQNTLFVSLMKFNNYWIRLWRRLPCLKPNIIEVLHLLFKRVFILKWRIWIHLCVCVVWNHSNTFFKYYFFLWYNNLFLHFNGFFF